MENFFNWIISPAYDFAVYSQGTEIGVLHFIDAVTFRSGLYKGRDPLKPDENAQIRRGYEKILYDASRFARLDNYRASLESK